MVEAVSRSTQTDPAMAATLCLGFTAAAVARRAVLVGPSGRRDPLHLWVLVVAPSGENKSGAFGPLMAPLDAVQVALEATPTAAETDPASAEPQALPSRTRWQRLMEAQTDDVLEHAAPPSQLDVAHLLGASAWATRDLAAATIDTAQRALHPTVQPAFLLQDATPESIFEVMGEQAAAVLQAAPEGGFAGWLNASPRTTNHLRNLNIAWDGGNIRTGRVGRRTLPIHRAALGLVFSPQPGVLDHTLRNRLIRETGFLPRFLVAYPEPRRGSRRAPFDPTPQDVRDAYDQHIWALMTLPLEGRPVELRLDAEGAAASNDFFNTIEPRIGGAGDLAGVDDWVEKLRLNLLRIAGILHLSQYAAGINVGAHLCPVSGSTMDHAIEIVTWLIPHGQRAFGRRTAPVRSSSVGAERDDEVVLDVLVARERFASGRFSARDVHRSAQTRFASADVVQRGLDQLVARGVLSRDQQGRQTVFWFCRDETPSDSDR
jgi:hypothetical protein